MRVTTLLHTETSLAAIADRLYAKLTDSSRKTAESALLKANPDLAKSEAFRSGVIIQIPDVPSLSLNVALPAPNDPISQIGELLTQALDGYEKSLQESNSSAFEAIDKQIELLDPKLLRILKSLEIPATQDLKAVLNKRRQENESQHKNMIASLEQAKTEIKDLFK